MKILFIGDVFGSPGRDMVIKHLDNLKLEYGVDFVIANAENAAHGKGLTYKIYHQLIEAGVDFITMGNHTWSKPEIVDILKDETNIIRPANLSPVFKYHDVGLGSKVVLVKNKKIRITNLMGQTVIFKNYKTNENYATNPFIYFEDFLVQVGHDSDLHIVDFHSEMSSEKNAFLRAFCNRVQVIVGTHTHIPSNDAQIYKNTAYISDVGMTGPFEGIIGGLKEPILDVFYERADRFRLDVQDGLRQFSSVLIEFDEVQNKVIDFYPIILREDRQISPPIIKFVNPN